MTTVSEIRAWLVEGQRQRAGHVIVMVDDFDHEDYPVYVELGADVEQRLVDITHNMQRPMEVYDLALDIEAQLAEHRAWHVGAPAARQE
jgi:hypothetical protein